MATIRVYLDRRRKLKDGTYPIKLVVQHINNIMLSTPFTANEKEWGNDKFKSSALNYKARNSYLNNFYAKIENIILDLEKDDELKKLSDKQLKSTLLDEDSKVNFFSVFSKYANSRNADRTKEIYRYTQELVFSFDKNATFETVNRDWLTRFENSLSPNSINSIAIHMRNIRAVFNYALDEELTTNYPFRKFKIRREETPHLNLDFKEMKRIIAYSGRFEVFRDFFMLSFYLIGMNLKDILMIKKADYIKGRIMYRRLKTGELYNIKVYPEALEIIEKYKGKDDLLLSFIDMYKDYSGFKRAVNYSLKKLQDDEGVINEKLSTYYARHTWATMAGELDIPKETISAALGHRIGSKTTGIYINFDQRKIDVANKQVIDYISQDKEIEPK